MPFKTVGPKFQLLIEFTQLLFQHDPMKTAKSPDEYEGEALSILSRFCEAALQLADNEQAVIDFATETVKQTFRFWFGEAADAVDLRQVTLELIKAYIESFPSDLNEGTGATPL